MNKTAVVIAVIAALVLLPALATAAVPQWLKNIIEKVKRAFPLNAVQIQSLNEIAAAFRVYGDSDPRKFAYIVATAWHESRLQPIREKKAAPGSYVWENYQKKYWDTGYYGRGFVQITWEANYEKIGAYLGIPLVQNPDLALQPDVAAKIIVAGMMRGMFTGKSLPMYINADGADYYNARRTVGAIMVAGTDTAALIEGYTKTILNA